MASDREIDQIYQRLGRVEEKVDKLLDFRAWVLGVVAAVSAAASYVFALVFKDR